MSSRSSATGTSCPQDNILCCPVCMDVYKSPRMLPCQHTLCETCLHSYIVNKSRERVLVSDFPCPVCRASTPAPRAFTRIDTWASLFPLNHLLVSLLDSSFQELLERAETCSNASVAGDRCSAHAGKPIEFFCTEHGVKICSKCFKNNHRQCDVLDIEEHVELTSRFNVVKSDVENVLEYLNEAITQLQSNIDQLCSQKSSILAEVQELRGKVETLFNAIESEIVNNVNVQHDGEVEALTAQCQKYERIKSQLADSERTLTDLPMAGNVSETLDRITAIERDIKEHLATIRSCHAGIRQIKLEFSIDGQLISFLNSFTQIGNINSNYFDSNLPDPPELNARDNAGSENFMPSTRDTSRDTSMTSEDLQPSSPPVRHVSPRAIFISRSNMSSTSSSTSTATTTATTSFANSANKCTTSHIDANIPPRHSKEPKRPKTVPIESNAPTPVVRPRPERPGTRDGIPNFIPRSCSSPVTSSLGASSSSIPSESSTDGIQQQDSCNKNVDDSTHGAVASKSVVCSTLSSLGAAAVTGRKLLVDKPKHRAWQYVNMVSGSGVGDSSLLRRNSEKDDTVDDAGVVKQLFRHRSSSASDGERERLPEQPFTVADDTFATSVNAATSSFNQIIRSFQNKLTPTQREIESAPVYENSVLASVASPPTSDRQFTFTLPNTTATMNRNNPKNCSRMKDINVRIESDVRECTITGSVEMADRRLVLIDCNNSKVKLFNTDIAYVAHLDMTKEPWNVATMSPNEIAVTVPLEKTIHVVRVASASMSTLRCIATRRECWGVAYIDRKFITTTKDDGNQVSFLDDNGRELQVVNFASRENPNILRPVSLSVSSDGAIVYVCCEGQSGTKGSLVRMSSRGDVLYVFANKDLDRPYSAAPDANNEHVFVTAIRSANVLMLSEGGASVLSLLTRENGLTRPQHLHVTSWDGKTVLIITERRSDKAFVYCVK
ncbi:uncharacterized protein LOC127854676 [Dreissena polymorpha]|uniref:RING-type domain-containing protein n=1 Tax=Dreissena polymorpha TaxID=45954 RepID=A0A9D4C9L0_DREPO|nr:uncharacterized protein LOC127854676 [Dreissena polymorpha]KAH3720057.1 hypothetical protein DPMN_062950 [Dreissena polymorpha]